MGERRERRSSSGSGRFSWSRASLDLLHRDSRERAQYNVESPRGEGAWERGKAKVCDRVD